MRARDEKMKNENKMRNALPSSFTKYIQIQANVVAKPVQFARRLPALKLNNKTYNTPNYHLNNLKIICHP